VFNRQELVVLKSLLKSLREGGLNSRCSDFYMEDHLDLSDMKLYFKSVYGWDIRANDKGPLIVLDWMVLEYFQSKIDVEIGNTDTRMSVNQC